MADIPQPLVDAVQSELIAMYASRPDGPMSFTDDARTILAVLAHRGVTFPAEREPCWVVTADGKVIDANRVSRLVIQVGQPAGIPDNARTLAETITEHLNGHCTEAYKQLTAAARALRDDVTDLHDASESISRMNQALDTIDKTKETSDAEGTGGG